MNDKLFKDIKIIVHIHFADYNKIITGKKFIDNQIIKILNSSVDSVVFLSYKTKEQFVKHGLLESKTNVVYNFYTQNYTEKVLSSKTGILKLLFVGAISQRKGLYDLMTCLGDISHQFELHVCGDFLDEKDKEIFSKLKDGLGDSVIFHGYVNGDQKKKIFSEADILVLPSYAEGLPVVLLEGMSSGCVIISSKVGAIPEIIKENNGKLISPGNLTELSDAVNYYLNKNRDDLKVIQNTNYEESKKYSIDAFADNIYRIIKDS